MSISYLILLVSSQIYREVPLSYTSIKRAGTIFTHLIQMNKISNPKIFSRLKIYIKKGTQMTGILQTSIGQF